MGPSEDAEGGGVDERDARDVDDDARAAEGQGLTQADRDVVSREDVELAVGGQMPVGGSRVTSIERSMVVSGPSVERPGTEAPGAANREKLSGLCP